ncbi:hypothetical protein GGR51DRAFT_518860 [Nemania sp. FL0031]|nr:hypothetical protein GGR51DRAFT_518860 [Nemania sp. FL0031]
MSTMKNSPTSQLRPNQQRRQLKRRIRRVPISKPRATPTTTPTIASQRHMESQEIIVSASSPLPPDYKFLPKGNHYMTCTCRRRTLRARQAFYVVVNDEKKRIGIRVPARIYEAARKSEHLTRGSRQRKVIYYDRKLEERFTEAIRDKFPQIPPDELLLIKQHATRKRSGRVGRTQTIEIAERAHLATQAHIRHTKTEYDELLKRGIDRETARVITSQKVYNILKQWTERPEEGNYEDSA